MCNLKGQDTILRRKRKFYFPLFHPCRPALHVVFVSFRYWKCSGCLNNKAIGLLEFIRTIRLAWLQINISQHTLMRRIWYLTTESQKRLEPMSSFCRLTPSFLTPAVKFMCCFWYPPRKLVEFLATRDTMVRSVVKLN